MIYAIKLLLSALLAAGAGAFLFRKAFDDLMSRQEYRRAWVCIGLATCAAFLCKFPPVFLVVIGLLAAWQANTMRNGTIGNIAVFLMLSAVLPPIEFKVGVGGVGFLLQVSHFRALALALLVGPALKLLSQKAEHKPRGLLWIDMAILAYQLFRIALKVPSSTSTTIARLIVESALDVLLPYYVLTRGIRTLSELRFAVAHLMLGLIFVASVGLLEAFTQHNIYSGLQSIYGITWQLSYVLARGGLIRVQSTAPVPINLAITMMFALGLWIWLHGREWRTRGPILVTFAFLLCMIATWSRGPWLAAAAMLAMIFVVHRVSSGTFRILVLLTLAAGIFAKLSGADGVILGAVNSLFGGSDSDLASFDYRRQLLDTSLALIAQSPLWGVANYAAQMQSLRQGEGIVDIVNTYVGIMLEVGLVGLFIYLAPFVVVVHRLLKEIRRDPSGGIRAPGSRFAAMMVALILGMLFAIFTTSTFGFVALQLTLCIALSAAWLAMPTTERHAVSALKLQTVAPVRWRLAAAQALPLRESP